MGSPLERLILSSRENPNQHSVYVGTKLTVPPTVEPLDLAVAKLHARVENGVAEDDGLLNVLIVAARQYVERATQRSLITQTWELVLDTFPNSAQVKLPFGPVQSVTSVTTYDEANAAAIFTSTGYLADTYGDRVTLVDGYSWPSDLRANNGVIITFVAGYGSDPEDVPAAIQQAMLMLIAHWYENRESVVPGSTTTPIKQGVDTLLAPYMRRRV